MAPYVHKAKHPHVCMTPNPDPWDPFRRRPIVGDVWECRGCASRHTFKRVERDSAFGGKTVVREWVANGGE